MQSASRAARRQVRPCRFFATARGCRRGASCGFAHLDPPQSDDVSNAGNAATDESLGDASLQQRFYMWRRMIPRELHPFPLGRRLGYFFQEAFDLVSNGGAAVQQEVVEKLAESGGLKRIIELSDAIQNHSERLAIFEHELFPLLQILTHAEVLSSPVLEKPVSQIYEILYGVHGTRLLPWFSSLLGLFHRNEPRKSEQSLQLHDVLLLATTSLLGILRYNGHAATLDGNIKTFTERLNELHDHVEEFGEDRTTLHQSRRILGRIHHYLSVGAAVRSSDGSAPVQDNGIAKFVLEQDRPGGRHDNDFDQISDIAIMPTFEEIQSSSAEYLPVTDRTTWHLSGIRGLVDRQFRLLREDTVGQLRDTVRAEIQRLQNPETARTQPKREAAKTYSYLNVLIKNFVAVWQHGLTIEVEFDLPNALLDLNKSQRQEWWESHRRLQKEAVVCLIDGSTTNITFCSVDRLLPKDLGSDAQTPALGPTTPKMRTSLLLHLIQTTDITTQWLGNVLTGGAYRPGLTMIEFPGVLLPSFRPTLVALQNMSLNMDIPFPSLLEFDPKQSVQPEISIPPPAYTDKRNFRYNLRAITRNGEDLELSIKNDFDIQSLIDRSSLDEGQAKAVVDSLCRSMALVQGPPGTGKSYTGVALIRILLDNAAQGNIDIGPIVCVTYTNHAVDQLLEQLLDAGVKQMIRIGGRGKSEALAAVNLREVSKNIQRTKTEKRSFHDLVERTTEEATTIEELTCRLKRLSSWNSIKGYLQELHPHHYEELLSDDGDGFTRAISRKEDVLRWWLTASDAPNRVGLRDVAILAESSLWDMSKVERDRLHRYWLKDIELRTNRDLCQAVCQFEQARACLQDLRDCTDLRCLQQACIIGLTTTGLAKKLPLLRRLRAKVVVMEEAGEILEAHSLTSLLPSTEHCILIGDHLQLMPQINNYSLARESREGEKYSFNTSLFERLIDSSGPTNLPFTSLEVQRRMHPEISRLIRSYLYPQLRDAAAVSHYPEVAGVRNRLFWFDHSHHEDDARTNAQAFTGTSRTNSFEIDFVAAFVSHLVKQGEYHSGDIAVLTPYLGQLRRLKHRLRDTFEIALCDRDEDALALDVDQEDTASAVPSSIAHKTSLSKSLRIATIDNFQGEEAKVVVISLVRSNPEAKVGFLTTSNRINVLLSRAKHGMIVIGNSETARTAPMMANTISLLRDSGRIGPRLPLCCPRHVDAEISVADADDFIRFSPEGGCGLFCSQRLSCGHKCPNKCHSDALHEAVYCMEQCTRVKSECGHICPLICGQKCDKQCQQAVRLEEHRRGFPCGHIQDEVVECWQAQDPNSVVCTVLCDRTVPQCGHVLRVPCYQDTNGPRFRCPAECGSQLPCGHRCKRLCTACRIQKPDGSVEEDHGVCGHECGRGYSTCRHSCRALCHGGSRCEPCEAICENRCAHSTCSKPCNQACMPCAAADCDSYCPHSRCSMPCAAPCDHLPCGIRCDKSLSCGHTCPSVCGERCPDAKYCQTCGEEDIKARQVDFLTFESYVDVDVDENPCVFLPCGHFYTVETLDGIMSMERYYKTIENGKCIGLASNSEPFSIHELKLCPECRGSMRGVRRYGRIVRRALLDEATKKFIVWANQVYVSLASRLHEEQTRLSEAYRATIPSTATKSLILVGHVTAQLSAIRKATEGRLYRSLFGLRKEIHSYKAQVSQEEQPFQRVFDLVSAARQRNASSAKENFSFDSTVVLTRYHLQASALLLRCDLLIISYAVDWYNRNPTGPLRREFRLDFTDNMSSCEQLIEDSRANHNPLSEVEGHVFFAQFCALQRQAPFNASDSKRLFQCGLAHIAQAWDVQKAHPMTTRAMISEIETVERLLQGGVFYAPVTNDEMRQVVAAMAADFSVTGHWYYCRNGHPFTVGECGMPMETSTCPQCGAQVGGSHHRSVEGVEPARDLEEEFGRIAL